MRRTAVGATVALVLLVAACGGSPSSAGPRGSSNAGGTTGSQSANSQLLAFSRCMRSHGVPSFPDPNGSGKPSNATPQQLGVSNSQYQEAESACQHLLPYGSNGPTSAQVEQYRATMLKYARCMRTHGVSDFPDPDSRGRLDIGPGSDVPVNTPQFQSAFQVCKDNLSYYQSP